MSRTGGGLFLACVVGLWLLLLEGGRAWPRPAVSARDSVSPGGDEVYCSVGSMREAEMSFLESSTLKPRCFL